MLLIFYIEWDVEMSALWCRFDIQQAKYISWNCSQKMEWINQSVRYCWAKPKHTYIVLFSYAIFLGDNWFTVHFLFLYHKYLHKWSMGYWI